MNQTKIDPNEIKDYLIQHNLDAVLAMNPRTVAYLMNVRRFDHYTFQNNLFPDYPVFPRKGDPWLVGAHLDKILPQPLRPAWIEEYYDSGSSIFDDNLSLLIDTLKEKGLSNGCIGMDFDSVPLIAYKQLQEELPGAVFEDASVLFQQLKARKSDWEVRLLKRSLEALEAGSQHLLKEASPGEDMQSLMKGYAREVEDQGGAYMGGNWTNSSREWFPEELLPDRNLRYSKRWILEPNEVIRVNTLGYRGGYWSDNGMMFSLGKPRREDIERCGLQWQALKVIAKEIKPSMTAREAYQACREALQKVGYEGPWDCHSIGLDVMEDPWMGIGNERRESEVLRFEPKTVICIEAGSGAEQSFVMGTERLHRMSELPQRLHIL